MVIGLVKDLLGPRNGPFETLPLSQDPRTEYITGVLAPEQPQRDPEEIEADIDEFIEEVTDDELPGTTEGAAIAPPSAFSPALDPKAQPRSIGLSFVIVPDEAENAPVIDICATWARYEKRSDGWVRRPAFALLGDISLIRDLSRQKDEFRQMVGGDVALYMSVRHVDNHYRVSLHLLNERCIDADGHPDTPDFVFQPQIRVHCASGKLAPVDATGVEALNDPFAQEDAELALLYRQRPVLARGHLCGATWRMIDPERQHPVLPSPDEAPFAWTDRVLVSPEVQRRFSPADVRTEFLPCYPVEAPETDWLWTGPQPEFDLLKLSEMWEPEEIHSYLDPLVEGYEQWIETQEQQVPSLPRHWQEPAKRNLSRCREAAGRMREGVDWLIQDEDVRLAFCFANRAIALQSQWARKGLAFPWRPFQLAFLLLNIAGIADPAHQDRTQCDLLWFPTGGGKTEAYLGLAAFTLGLRRLRTGRSDQADRGAGVGVLSRYTLRLLTIQQFRRALGVITACEFLRVANLTRKLDNPVGWRPAKCQDRTSFLWGTVRFSAGMWVGGNVTPNNLLHFEFPTASGRFQIVAGALDILRGVSSYGYDGPTPELQRRYPRSKHINATGDPAQVLSCPVCGAILAIPEKGLKAGQHTLHFVFKGRLKNARITLPVAGSPVSVDDISPVIDHSDPMVHTLSITFTVENNRSFGAKEVDRWWYEVISRQIPMAAGQPELLAARPARPGYFLSTFQNQQGHTQYNNFEMYCPNPHCELNCHDWVEQVPLNMAARASRPIPGQTARWNKNWSWQEVLPFVRKDSTACYAERIPIPACTTDDQIYHRCPSLVIATVDKFARLSFEPKAGSLFGNVTHYHAYWGFYRQGCAPGPGSGDHPTVSKLRVPVQPFLPPDLVIQDELHLLEGPLGSMVGLYETAVDALSERVVQGTTIRPKYVSSSATVRQAESQVQALFERKLASFPPSAISVDDRFFARTAESHPLECDKAGRLYIGVSAPGKGAQTPIIRIWSALLQKAWERRNAGTDDELDRFWTLVGYFNALRELAGALALYRQDIPQRLQEWDNPRVLEYEPMELSSRASSLDLPAMLDKLGNPWSSDAVLATSMFGTGVDVNRLGLMVVHGQPKTTSAYIQATGRVGRSGGGLIVSFFRVSRPRDLDHYEFFTGYHRMLYRAVEPVTVTPFAPRARERCLGPLSVALLRQGKQIGGIPILYPWLIEQRVSGGFRSEAIGMDQHRYDPEVTCLPDLFERRAQNQPDGRRPPEHAVRDEAASELDRWHDIASRVARAADRVNDRLVYNEPAMTRTPERSVVLGDAQHQLRQLPVAFENAPNSLRDVEETTQFKE
jgi:hypothetical protein